MPRTQWALRRGRPCVQVVLTLSPGGQAQTRTLLADTGAGSRNVGFEILLEEDDCLLCGGFLNLSIILSGAYAGSFPIYDVPVQTPALGFSENLRVVGVPSVPAGFEGIACFGFLNRFTYGNFGDANEFGLES